MNDRARLEVRVRAVQAAGIGLIALTGAAWFLWKGQHSWLQGLLVGEFGGAYVVYSMIRQGHRNDNVQGPALFLSGMLGMFTRFVVLAVVLIAAIKFSASAVAALIGYLLGYVLVFAGLAGFLRNSRTSTEGK